MMARMMTQGTVKKTPQELEEAIQQLGASINVNAGVEDVRIGLGAIASFRAGSPEGGILAVRRLADILVAGMSR